MLETLDLTQKIKTKEYEKILKKLQIELIGVERKIMNKEIPVMIAFEGWDAGGKGGAIKRLTQFLDPRGYHVFSIRAPNIDEARQHYLWRFWNKTPRNGQIVIFDRSWYGRVLVERVEGFAKKKEWERAYCQINEFEKTLAEEGTIIFKFFIHISKDEQMRRFKARETDPLKKWKLTDEDWRNRKKWDKYLKATEDMLALTNTEYAPWYVIEGNNKKFARVKVIKTVIKRLKSVNNKN